MNRLVFTGTSPGLPAKDRFCSSFILIINDKIYQFDAGEGFSSSIQRLKINYNLIRKIFISHLHPDHIAGIFLELQLMYLTNRDLPLDIYAPAEGVQGLEQACRMFYLFKEKFPFEFRFLPILPNPVFRENDLAIYADANQHLAANQEVIRQAGMPNRMQSYSFVIVANGKRILYTGDIKDEQDLEGLVDNAHTVITEGMHGDFERLAIKCARAGVRRLIITHLPATAYSHPQKLIKIAAKNGIKKVLIARDGMKITI
jgi:ribonuclease BN (tRNA processing enzyme)